ncbi:MAG: DUF488 domain-containing protein [Proteobacteria bacterium]|nr:DUF488 domain-containing protein [Pseudomonadota bacterium]
MNLFTIGFTQTTAKHFFGRLMDAEIKRVLDVRLNNTSQLAGFAKAKDLPYFLNAFGGIDYHHEPLLAPTQDILTAFKKMKGEWSEYEKRFLDLMERRKIDERLDPGLFDQACLLCSEAEPHHCHRRLVAEYLTDRWRQPIIVKHL